MKKRKIIAAILTLSLLAAVVIFPPFSATAHAESGRITFNDPTAQLGNSLSVYMWIKTGTSSNYNVASVDITLSYDPEYLQFVTATGGMGNLESDSSVGSLVIKDKVNRGTSTFGCYLRFNTLKAGSTKLRVESCTVLDRNGNRFSMSYGTASIVISESSAVATLDTLSISGGELYPEFSSQTLNYTAYVPYEANNVNVSLKTTKSSSTYRIVGNTDLSVGENTIKVVVTAEGGTTSTYSILVTRLDQGVPIPDEPKEPISADPGETGPSGGESFVYNESGEVALLFVRDDVALRVMNFDDSAIPAGFSRASIDFNGMVLPSCEYNNSDEVKPIVYLEGTASYPTGFYYFTESTGRCTAMASIQAGNYTIMDMLSTFKMPDAYRDGTCLIGGASYKVFTPKDVDIPNHYIVCAVNQEGLAGLYVYDVTETTLQRYDFMELAITEVIKPDDGDQLDNEGNEKKEVDTTFKSIASLLGAIGVRDNDEKLSNLILFLLIAIFCLLLVIAVILYLMGQQKAKYRRDLKFNIPKAQIHAEAMDRENARAKLAKREAKLAKKMEKRQKRKLKKLVKEAETEQQVNKPAERRDVSDIKDIHGMVSDPEPLDSDILKYDLGASEGHTYYDRDIESILSELGIENGDE